MKVIQRDKLIIRQSMSMFFGGGEIFFIQLDSLSIYTQLVKKKFSKGYGNCTQTKLASDDCCKS